MAAATPALSLFFITCGPTQGCKVPAAAWATYMSTGLHKVGCTGHRTYIQGGLHGPSYMYTGGGLHGPSRGSRWGRA